MTVSVHASKHGPQPVKLKDDGGAVTWPAGELQEALRRTSFAMSTEETRYYLNGVFLNVSPAGTVDFIATDGHRLAKAETGLLHNPAHWPENFGKCGLIVPSLAVHALAKALAVEKDGDYPITVYVAENGMAFRGRDFELTTKAIDGSFPDYERVIPVEDAEGRANAEFDIGAFGECLASVVGRDAGTLLINGDARVELGGDAGEATIPGSPDIGENKIGLNPRYLVDIAKVFGGPVIMNYDREYETRGELSPSPSARMRCRATSRCRCPCGSDAHGPGRLWRPVSGLLVS